jgi:hypothetical protein
MLDGTSLTLKVATSFPEYGLKIILIYWPSYTNFIYAITFNIFQNTTKRKEVFPLERTTFVYLLSSDLWISGLTPAILFSDADRVLLSVNKLYYLPVHIWLKEVD